MQTIQVSPEDVEALVRIYDFVQGGAGRESIERLYVILGRLGVEADTPYWWPKTTWREPGSK